MSATEETAAQPAPEGAPNRRRPARWAIICGVALAVAAAVGIAVVARDDGSDPDSARLEAQQGACHEWMGESGPGEGADTRWCDDMTGWMRDRMRAGGMMGSMMWGDPQAMRDTCTQWMAAGPAIVDDTEGWCDDMVGWMDEHAGDWGGWMHDLPG